MDPSDLALTEAEEAELKGGPRQRRRVMEELRKALDNMTNNETTDEAASVTKELHLLFYRSPEELIGSGACSVCLFV
jgi:hypothetical protein